MVFPFSKISLDKRTSLFFLRVHDEGGGEKCLISCGLYYKSCFMIVIYDRNDSAIVIYDLNDSGLYYKTTIVARYELKLRSKLKRNLRS